MKKPIEKHLGPVGHRQRLRERFLKAGRNGLADYELLELLLTYAIPRIDTKPIAKALLHEFGSVVSVLQQPDHRLMGIHGIGPNTVTFLRVFQACLTRCTETEVEQQLAISGPEDVFAYIRLHLGPRTNECVYGLYLNDARCIVHQAEIAAGTINRAPLYPREVLKPALVYDATGMILVHNHPEGQPIPSDEDLEMTKEMEKVATPLGINLIDHLIVTKLQAFSIKTGKLL